MLSSGCSSFPRLPCTVWIPAPTRAPSPSPGWGGDEGQGGALLPGRGEKPGAATLLHPDERTGSRTLMGGGLGASPPLETPPQIRGGGVGGPDPRWARERLRPGARAVGRLPGLWAPAFAATPAGTPGAFRSSDGRERANRLRGRRGGLLQDAPPSPPGGRPLPASAPGRALSGGRGPEGSGGPYRKRGESFRHSSKSTATRIPNAASALPAPRDWTRGEGQRQPRPPRERGGRFPKANPGR